MWLNNQKYCKAGNQNIGSSLYHIDGVPVCTEFFSKALNVSRKRLYNKIAKGGPAIANKRAVKSEEICVWLDNHAKIQEIMPHLSRKTVQFCYPNKLAVYNVYKDDSKKQFDFDFDFFNYIIFLNIFFV